MSAGVESTGDTPFRQDRTGLEARLADLRAAWLRQVPAAERVAASLAPLGRRVGLGLAIVASHLGIGAAIALAEVGPPFSLDGAHREGWLPFLVDLWLLGVLAVFVSGLVLGTWWPRLALRWRLWQALRPGVDALRDLERLETTAPMDLARDAQRRWRRHAALAHRLTTLWAVPLVPAIGLAVYARLVGGGISGLFFVGMLAAVLVGPTLLVLTLLALPGARPMPAWPFLAVPFASLALWSTVLTLPGLPGVLVALVVWTVPAIVAWRGQRRAAREIAAAEAAHAERARQRQPLRDTIAPADTIDATRDAWVRALPGAEARLPTLATIGRRLGLRAAWLLVQAGCALTTLVTFVLLVGELLPDPDVTWAGGPSAEVYLTIEAWTLFALLALATVIGCLVVGHVVAPWLARWQLWRTIWPSDDAAADLQRLARSPGEIVDGWRVRLATWAAWLRPWAAGSLLFHVLFVGLVACVPEALPIEELPFAALLLWIAAGPSQLGFAWLITSRRGRPAGRAVLGVLAALVGGYAPLLAGVAGPGALAALAGLVPLWLVQLIVVRWSRARAARELAAAQ